MAFSRNDALSYLQRAHDQNRLAHAYLISGPAGSGKRALASDLAEAVNGADGIFLAEPESKSRKIVIEQIRDLEHTLQMRAADGRRKVAIISEADRLQPQAANAFLKTLEEPPKDSLLLLLSALPEALPDTILSRCIAIPLSPNGDRVSAVEENNLVELLNASMTAHGSAVQRAYRLARGLQVLLAGIRENIQEQNEAALKQEEMRYKNTTDGSWLDERADHYKALGESLYLQRRARLIEIIFAWWSDVLRAKTGGARVELPAARKQTAALAQKLSTTEILRRIRRIEQLRDHLGRNIQEALAIEIAFLSVFDF
ncbi:MAG: polymerase subunit delta [Verrucomicrobiota bacterium]|jgi:DNA polymerase-3 subunit delta'